MTPHGELTIQRDEKGGSVVTQQVAEADPIKALMIRAATDPNFNVDAIERITALFERQEKQKRKDHFDEALARVQAKSPRVRKDGMMDRGPGKGQIAYARFEDVDAVMRPIYQAEGFSVNWDSPMIDGKIKVVGKFSAFGHTEEREWWCAPDSSGGKQSPQATGSTISYGKRYLSIMFWNVITEGEDTNGTRREDVEPITESQALDIRTRMNDLKQRQPGSLLAILCRKYGVDKPEQITKSQYENVIRDVEATEARQQ